MSQLKLNNRITKNLKKMRVAAGLSQEKIAEELSISVSNYKRIELGYNQYIDKEVRNALSKRFDLNDNFWLESASKKISYRIPIDLYEYLQVLKMDEDLDLISDAEAISHCIVEYQKMRSFKQIRYELEDTIETAILNTYGKTLSSITKQLQDYEYLRNYLHKELGIDVNEVLEANKKRNISHHRANAY